MARNVGSAMLILGTLYLHLIHNLNFWITLGLCVLAVTTWTYVAWADDRKELLKSQIKYYQAKAGYYNRKEK